MTAAPLNILMIDSHAEIERGGAIQCARLAATLAERGHQVTCIFDQSNKASDRTGAEWKRLSEAGVTIIRRSLSSIAAILRFRGELEALSPDIVHTHKNRALYFLAGGTLNRRSFGWVANRGTEYSLLREPPAWAIHRYWVDRIIPVADAVKAQLVSDGIPLRNLQTIYGSVDVDRFRPAVSGTEMRKAWGVPPDAPVIGMAASFKSRKKGQPDLVRAAAEVLKAHSNAWFVLAGDGSPDGIRKLAGELGIAERVRFPGFISDMPAALAAMDVVVCASRRGEGLTGSVREALAMARPVVSTDVAGNGELVRNGETGLLTPTSNPQALAEAISRLLGNPADAAAMGKAGRALVLRLCSDDARATAVEQLYRELLDQRGAAKA